MPRITTSRIAAAAVCGTVAVAFVPSDALATATRVDRMVRQTNNVRDRHSLHNYRDRRHLTAVAQRWATWMAVHRDLKHNPNLTTEVGNWCYVGENVGRGPSEHWVQRHFMRSRPHRRNILSRHFHQVGIGTQWDGSGELYVDQVFRKPC